MRAVLVLAASLAVTACGAEERSGGGPASTSATDVRAEEQSPPPVLLLVSRAGEQEGVQGSYCVGTGEVLACAYGLALDPQGLSSSARERRYSSWSRRPSR